MTTLQRGSAILAPIMSCGHRHVLTHRLDAGHVTDSRSACADGLGVKCRKSASGVQGTERRAILRAA